ncbi:ABC transporter permease [Haladaptatus sp. GCM10025707]|uniref:ABC transporter permease n=2 Tax=Haladaptatus TaxID=367188 RepID=UPI0023E7EDAA|nr:MULTISPECIES: ABC transporter permease [unclassified Haladaptatus]
MKQQFEAAVARMTTASNLERIAISIAALVASILVGGVVVLVAGFVAQCSQPVLFFPGVGYSCYNPVSVYVELFLGPFSGPGVFGETLQQTTILLLTGLSVAIAFRAGLFNIGTQGQFVMGSMATAIVVPLLAPAVPANAVGALILIPLGLLAGALVGGLYGAIPGALKAYAEANEVITTIMLNFIATFLALLIVSTWFKDPNSTNNTQTAKVPDFAMLDSSVLPGDFSFIALALALALVATISWLLVKTAFGYDLRISGIQEGAAAYSGVSAKKMTVLSMALSGALGGIAGAVYILMVTGRWLPTAPAFGFDGITVSILAGNNPVGAIFAAFLFGILKVGRIAIDFNLDVPSQLVGVLRGLIILFVAMPEFFRMFGTRFNVGSDMAVTTDGGEDT